MNRIEKNKTQTDQAWNKLHNRLETDGLLPTVTERRFATRPTVWIGIAAIAAIISLCVYLPTVLRTDRHLSGGELYWSPRLRMVPLSICQSRLHWNIPNIFLKKEEK